MHSSKTAYKDGIDTNLSDLKLMREISRLASYINTKDYKKVDKKYLKQYYDMLLKINREVFQHLNNRAYPPIYINEVSVLFKNKDWQNEDAIKAAIHLTSFADGGVAYSYSNLMESAIAKQPDKVFKLCNQFKPEYLKNCIEYFLVFPLTDYRPEHYPFTKQEIVNAFRVLKNLKYTPEIDSWITSKWKNWQKEIPEIKSL